jgi:hypothetical protein
MFKSKPAPTAADYLQIAAARPVISGGIPAGPSQHSTSSRRSANHEQS